MNDTASEGSGRIARNFLALFSAQAVAAASGLVSTAFLARVLGTEAFGVLGFGTALLSYFGLLVVFGTDVFGAREIAQNRAGAAGILRTLLGLRTVAVAAVSIVYVLTVGMLDLPERVRTVLWIQGAGLFVTAYTLDFVFQGLQRMGPMAVRQVMAALLVLAAVLALIRSPADIYIAAAIPVCAIGISVLWLNIRMHRTAAPFAVAFEPAAWKPVLRAALPIAVAQIMGAVYFHIDIVMLGFMATEHVVGLYVGMSRVLMIALLVGGLLGSAFMPAVAGAWPDSAAMRARYRDFITATMFVGAPVAAIGMAFPAEIVAIVFGDAYLGGTTALAILMAMAFAAYAAIAVGGALISWHDQKAHMVALSAGGISNVGLNLYLIPRYGIEGAAVATLAAQAIVLVLLIARLRLKFGLLEMGPPLALAFFAAVAFASVTVAARLAGGALVPGPAIVVFAVHTAAGCAIYLLLAAATGTVKPLRMLRLLRAPRGGPAGDDGDRDGG